jgi:hypothetical protein
MTKKLVIVAAMMTFCGGAMAQDEGTSSGGGFSSGLSLNTNNKYQISLLLGNQVMFNQNLTYLTPEYSNNAANAIGLPGTNSQSYSPLSYIRFNDLGKGDLVNMAGVQFTYFLTDGIDINASFGMDLRSTPKKDFIEGEQIKDMAIQGQKWIEGQFQNNWLLTLGGNYHFTVSNEKIDMYAGLQFGYQHGHINTYTPYTDADYAYLAVSELETKAAAAATAFEAAKGALAAAESAKNIAESYKDSWQSTYNTALTDYNTKAGIANTKATEYSAAKTKYETAKTNYDNAFEAWNTAADDDPNKSQLYDAMVDRKTKMNDAELASQNAELASRNAATDRDLAKQNSDFAKEAFDKAKEEYTSASTDYNKASSAKTAAESAANAAKAAAEEANATEGTVLYTPRIGSGQIVCFTTSVTAGVNYALSDGLFLGLEFSPYTFTYTSLSVCPKDNQVYKATAYANRFFANTLLKIGFRF